MPDAIRSMAQQAINKKVGARGLRRIIERILQPAMFICPDSNITEVTVDREVAEMRKQPIYKFKVEENNSENIINESVAADQIDTDVLITEALEKEIEDKSRK